VTQAIGETGNNLTTSRDRRPTGSQLTSNLHSVGQDVTSRFGETGEQVTTAFAAVSEDMQARFANSGGEITTAIEEHRIGRGAASGFNRRADHHKPV
jgi:hypothetical protein